MDESKARQGLLHSSSKVHPTELYKSSPVYAVGGKAPSPATSLTSAEKSSTARGGSHNSDGSEAPFQKLRNLTAFVPPPVLHRFIKNPQPLRQCECKSYQTSVLFADISGYSKWSYFVAEKHKSEQYLPTHLIFPNKPSG